jgi:uncharacterized protein YegP (UPF0339 family)
VSEGYASKTEAAQHIVDVGENAAIALVEDLTP